MYKSWGSGQWLWLFYIPSQAKSQAQLGLAFFWLGLVWLLASGQSWHITIPWATLNLPFIFPGLCFQAVPKRGGRKWPIHSAKGNEGYCLHLWPWYGRYCIHVSGDLMPRPPSILASLISMTFIGLGDLPKHWIWTTFYVHCQVVHL